MFLLDSNILIYHLSGNFEVADFLGNLKCEMPTISVISRLEVLIGSKNSNMSIQEVESYLDEYYNLPLEKAVAGRAARLAELLGKKLRFKDLIIAATALEHNLILVTADKDFEKVPELKIKFYSG